MTTTPLPRKPTGKLAFAYQTIATLEQARADLEAENKRLREALTDTLALLESYCGDLEESTRNQARAALESKP